MKILSHFVVVIVTHSNIDRRVDLNFIFYFVVDIKTKSSILLVYGTYKSESIYINPRHHKFYSF